MNHTWKGNNVSAQQTLKDDKFLFSHVLRVSASKGGNNVKGAEDPPILNRGRKALEASNGGHRYRRGLSPTLLLMVN